jgi:hypothetical protein
MNITYKSERHNISEITPKEFENIKFNLNRCVNDSARRINNFANGKTPQHLQKTLKKVLIEERRLHKELKSFISKLENNPAKKQYIQIGKNNNIQITDISVNALGTLRYELERRQGRTEISEARVNCIISPSSEKFKQVHTKELHIQAELEDLIETIELAVKECSYTQCEAKFKKTHPLLEPTV